MNENSTIEKMHRMHMKAMAGLYHQALSDHLYNNYTTDEFLTLLIDTEWEHRQKSKIDGLIKKAGFKQVASPQNIDYQSNRNLDRNVIERLLTLQFLERSENIIITGPTGSGKSFLGHCLATRACQFLYRTQYYPVARLLDKAKLARLDGTYSKLIKAIAKIPLIMLDDFLLTTVDQAAGSTLLDLIEERYEKKATIIATQIPVDQWHGLIGESTMADAILDRLVYSSHRIALTGESFRKKKKLSD
ncbi:IS21-like element helper ATPase IstB [Chitinophaga sp. LS1]|uniref:IS21-like element helper ATPase IstB n=1 Tax=Chitinophaga sp. LS1 TaxID=3051176 RepID=UPI002AABA8EF|nr:IS21-like element helper ATPase IstB [Chitinophaga sp. LS1]WPV70548.1 IS21-like element helper ATPase IstB [Chitinophaga sp. LS1]